MPELLQKKLFTEPEAGVLLAKILAEAESLFVKKLSRNDRDWAGRLNKHQAGIYVPPAARDSGFFPPLQTKVRDNPAADEIRETFLPLHWLETGVFRTARLAHYTSKGPETHLTRLPKDAFRYLSPASLMVIGKNADGTCNALTLDSEGTDSEILSDLLDLPPDFTVGIFRLNALHEAREARTFTFLDEVMRAYFDGTIAQLSSQYGTLPTTEDLANVARMRYLRAHGIHTLNPFLMEAPGDAIRVISRGLEYEIFKDLQMRQRVIELVRMLLGDDPSAITPAKALRAIVVEYPKIDALLLSAAQQRKSRAGYSFEHHIEALLRDGSVPHEKQVVIAAKKRPDFILPSHVLYADPTRRHDEALVLSAKTTLRERWKQVRQEISDCDLYLATVDENIAANAIEDMAAQGIILVVPESLKNSKTADYEKQGSVISFKTFFEIEIREKRWNTWRAKSVV